MFSGAIEFYEQKVSYLLVDPFPNTPTYLSLRIVSSPVLLLLTYHVVLPLTSGSNLIVELRELSYKDN